MRVYGDRPRRCDPQAVVAALQAELDNLTARRPGVGRHAALVAALIAAGELAQGVADAEFEMRGADAPSAAQDAAMAATLALAQAVIASWDSGFTAAAGVAPGLLEPLRRLALPGEISLKRPEGFAFYTLYPEAYAEAARPRAPAPDTCVIGLRSIGTSLSAMVAARLGADTPITVRPCGEPFRRELRLDPQLEARWTAAGPVAVVDEGPGLSGSSFGAVGDRLAALGVAPRRVVFYPGHAGDLGPQASDAHRRRWAAAERRVVSFDQLALADPARGLQGWVADLTGGATGALDDLSGGAWRARAYASEADWPPVHSFQEARKFALHTERGAWRLKFAGLDAQAPRKLARARRLHAAGFAPETAGLRHGFLVERDLASARPLDLERFPRPALIARVAAYLRFRAVCFPAEADAGAPLAELVEMARINAGEALGARAGSRLQPWADRAPTLQARVRRVETDNRLHPWEWLVTPDGQLLKTDAVDHAHAHDLVGCQDIAWDVAGAVVEFGLDAAETETLGAGLGADAALLELLMPCYLAFQLGAWAMAADAHGGWPQERARLAARRDRYAAALERRLAG